MSAEVLYTDDSSEMFDQVRLLSNGWVKASGPTDEPDVDVYIPESEISEVHGSDVFVGDPR